MLYIPLLLATASDILEEAKQVAAPFQNTTTAQVDVTSDSSLSSLITGHDLVIRSVVVFLLASVVYIFFHASN